MAVVVLRERGGKGGYASPNRPGGHLAWLGGGLHIDQDTQKMDIRKFLVTQEKSTDSVEAGTAAQECVDSVEGATTHSVTSSSRRSSSYLSGTFPNDLPVLVSVIHKQDILVKSHTQPSNCTFPRRDLVCHSTLPGTMPRRPKDGWSTLLKATRYIILCVVYLKVKLEKETG